MGQEENAGNQHLLPFPQMLSTLVKTGILVLVTLFWSSASAFNSVELKILSTVNSYGYPDTWTHAYKTFFVLISAEHEISKLDNSNFINPL